MKQQAPSSPINNRVLIHTGGWYPIVILLIVQVGTILLAFILAGWSSRVFTIFEHDQVTDVVIVFVLLLLARSILLPVLMYVNNRPMFGRLARLTKGSPKKDTEEGPAWRQASSFSWQYTLFALGTLLLITLPALLVYIHIAIGASAAQMTYVSLVVTAISLSVVVLENLIIEILMRPVREILFPVQIDMQLENLRGAPLLVKTLVGVVALTITGTLLIASTGYYQPLIARGGEIDSHLSLLTSTSIVILLFGCAFAYCLAYSVSSPIHQIIKDIDKDETDDLPQRLKITSTDETGKLVIYFNKMIARLESWQTGLEERVTLRTKLLSDTIEIGHAANASLDPDEVADKTVNMIADRFGHYYVAIFLIDSTRLWAELKSANGAVGQALRQRGYKLVLGGKSVVSAAITNCQACSLSAVGTEPILLDNPLLSATRSELALPLIAGEQVTGALDLHSSKEASFTEEDFNVFQDMANQIAIALENARLFQEMQKNLNDLRLKRPMQIPSIYPNAPVPAKGAPSLNVPLTPHLVEAGATQAALADENAHLVQETRQRAERERVVGQAASRIRESLDINTILRTTVHELQQVFALEHAEVRLQMVDQTSKTKRQRKS